MLITDPRQVPLSWLTAVLRRDGALSQGEVTAVQVETTETFTATAVRLCVSYSEDAPDSAPARLFLKLGHRRIEVEFYRVIAPAMTDPPVPYCYDAVFDPEIGQSHLLFEDLSATHVTPDDTPPLSKSDYQQVIDSLSIIHAQWWDHPWLGTELRALGEDVSGFVVGVVQDTFPTFVDSMGDDLSVENRRIYERLLAGWPPPDLVDRLAGGRAVTLVHGDAHPWNCLFPRDPSGGQVVLADWAVWHPGLGTEDVAYLIGMQARSRRAALEQPLVRTYHQRLLAHGVSDYTWKQCWLDYRTAAIFNLFWPVFHWRFGLPYHIWRPDLEGALAAFEDLRCEELLA
jgi:hypothetical protein